MIKAEELLSHVQSEYFNTVLVFGADSSFLPPARQAYPEAIIVCMDTPNNLRLFKNQFPDCYNRITAECYPAKNLKPIRFDAVFSFNSFSIHGAIPDFIKHVSFELLQADGMFFFYESAGEIAGFNLLDEAGKCFDMVMRFDVPAPEVAALFKKKNTTW